MEAQISTIIVNPSSRLISDDKKEALDNLTSSNSNLPSINTNDGQEKVSLLDKILEKNRILTNATKQVNVQLTSFQGKKVGEINVHTLNLLQQQLLQLKDMTHNYQQ